MRINRFVALATGLSRRAADRAISEGRVKLNNKLASLGDIIAKATDEITIDGNKIKYDSTTTTIMLNKPAGYVCSRNGQGSRTIYDLLPEEYHRLKPAGRLDKDSSGLILLTDDGELANKLTHPRYQKKKVYVVKLDKKLKINDRNKLLSGVRLEDGLSKFLKLKDCPDGSYEITIAEGRNRQIRRTFAALDYNVTFLHRTSLGPHKLPATLGLGKWKLLY